MGSSSDGKGIQTNPRRAYARQAYCQAGGSALVIIRAEKSSVRSSYLNQGKEVRKA